MSSIDDFLQELEKKHSTTPQSPKTGDKLDQALSNLQADLQQKNPAPQQNDHLQELAEKHRENLPSPKARDHLDDALANLQADLQQQKSAPKSTVSQPSVEGDRLSEMLKALEQDATANKLKHCEKNHQIYQEINHLIQTKQAQQKTPLPETDLKAIAAAEKKQQEQKKYWQNKAETFLKELDPISNEGLWFMEFADSYQSPLEAAIDYLMALE